MNTAQMKAFCGRLPGARSKLYGPPGNVLVYSIGGKQFAYFKTSDPEQWRFSFKVTPDRFVELTDVPGIKPARYMARFHWVTIVTLSSLPTAYLKELVGWSYQKALSAHSKVRQRNLLADTLK